MCKMMIATLVVLLYCTTTLTKEKRILVDIDGNAYKTIKIGNQIWMAENLRVTKLKDGTPMNLITDSSQWNNNFFKYCWVNNDTNNKIRFGALYNSKVVQSNKLAPSGWHVPNEDDWNTLVQNSPVLSILPDTFPGGWRSNWNHITEEHDSLVWFEGINSYSKWWIYNGGLKNAQLFIVGSDIESDGGLTNATHFSCNGCSIRLIKNDTLPSFWYNYE